jgi:hypothetical protein
MTTLEGSMTTAEEKWSEKAESAKTSEACPLCGNRMQEMLRAQEATSVFVWYECTKVNCTGRWLKQYSLV